MKDPNDATMSVDGREIDPVRINTLIKEQDMRVPPRGFQIITPLYRNTIQQMLKKKQVAGYNGIASLQLILGTVSIRYKFAINPHR